MKFSYKKIKTVNDAFKLRKVDIKKMPDVSMIPEHLQKHMIANYKILIVAQALNTQEDGTVWQPDWSNTNEWKYQPYFQVQTKKGNKVKTSGFGFSLTTCDSWSTFAITGSRLCFKTSEIAIYAGKQFKELYQETHLIR